MAAPAFAPGAQVASRYRLEARLKPDNIVVAAGTFRQDLYYRLVGATIAIAPLRERGADVVGLAETFLAQIRASLVSASGPRGSSPSRGAPRPSRRDLPV